MKPGIHPDYQTCQVTCGCGLGRRLMQGDCLARFLWILPGEPDISA